MFTPLWDGTERKELLLQRCSACAVFRHPPSPICQSCLSAAHEWVAASGRGTVYTYAVVRQALGRGWEDKLPYVVAVIELDEGPRFLTNLVDVEPEAVQIGMPVEVTYVERADAATLPLFRPRGA
jgi:uncharacterized OB-fold protein